MAAAAFLEKLISGYWKALDVTREAQKYGFRARTEQEVVAKWPYMFKPEPKDVEGSRLRLQRLMASSLCGGEIYIEWEREQSQQGQRAIIAVLKLYETGQKLTCSMEARYFALLSNLDSASRFAGPRTMSPDRADITV